MMIGALHNLSGSPVSGVGAESPDPRGMLNCASGFLGEAMQSPAYVATPEPQTKTPAPRKRRKKDPVMVLVDFKK